MESENYEIRNQPHALPASSAGKMNGVYGFLLFNHILSSSEEGETTMG